MCWRNFSLFSLVTKKCRKWVKESLFSNGCHFRMYIPKWKLHHFSEENYLNYMKKTQFCMWQLHFSWNKGRQEQAVDPLISISNVKLIPLDHVTYRWISLVQFTSQWHSHGGGGGGVKGEECPSWQQQICQKSGKSGEKSGKSGKKLGKRGNIGKKREKSWRFFHFAPPDR